MLELVRRFKLATVSTIFTALFLAPIGPANADDRQVRDLDNRHEHYDRYGNNNNLNKRNWHNRNQYRVHRNRHKSPRFFVNPVSKFSFYSFGLGNYGTYNWPRTYNHSGTRRPYGHRRSRFSGHFSDYNTIKFLGLTALGLFIFNELSESQRRAHKDALARANTARIGGQITWKQNNRSRDIIVTRKGRTLDGRPCREYQQEIVIGGNREQAYGTACMKPNGDWQFVQK
ncbi:MAG: hypothetical protein CMG46_07320 [Candidatus Marinimicrobia bacterium]|nr:hypothetical protein [Candidatus Neomarinimicrobiota bacterium]